MVLIQCIFWEAPQVLAPPIPTAWHCGTHMLLIVAMPTTNRNQEWWDEGLFWIMDQVFQHKHSGFHRMAGVVEMSEGVRESVCFSQQTIISQPVTVCHVHYSVLCLEINTRLAKLCWQNEWMNKCNKLHVTYQCISLLKCPMRQIWGWRLRAQTPQSVIGLDFHVPDTTYLVWQSLCFYARVDDVPLLFPDI
jgi:hypothetical protein